jgi:transposase
MNEIDNIKARFDLLKDYFDEKTKRLFCAAEAQILGRGGIAKVIKATKVAKGTIRRGIKDLQDTTKDTKEKIKKVRKSGGGRKKAIDKNPKLEKALLELVEPTVRGEPQSSLLWTTKSLRNLSNELKEKGFKASHTVVGDILKANKFSLQANCKTDEGSSHIDRDAQFNHIHNKVKEFQKVNNPVISIDAKKKELIGNFKNNGQEWHSKANPAEVNVYDFPSCADGKITPYGIYDITNNLGWVNVGIDKDTSEFAVQSIRNWWNKMGKELYDNATELLINADGGGSNGSRVRLWKKELQTLSSEIGLKITVCHFPPGTSKWNKIEHRLFSYISKNWRGRPLTSHEVAVNLIGSTTTKTGLKVSCELDENKYETGKKISDEEFNKINIIRDEFHGNWNYTILPRTG